MDHPDLLLRAVRRDPAKACVVEAGRTLTFAELHQRAGRLAAALLSAGLKPGDRVALLAQNGSEYVELQVAAQRAGLVFVPLNWRMNAAELATQVSDFEPSLLVSGTGFHDTSLAVGVSRVWHLGEDGCGPSYEDQLAGTEALPARAIEPSALAMLLYTSGTTGGSKGVKISNAAHLSRVVSLAMELRISHRDKFLQVMPMFHLSSLFTHAFVFVGATNIIQTVFDTKDMLNNIKLEKPTHTLLVPTAIGALASFLKENGITSTSLKKILYGGAPITSVELKRALSIFDAEFCQVYGLTESGPASVLGSEDHDPESRPELLASAGVEMPLTTIDVIDPAGRACPDGEEGELVIRGPGNMDGYWNQPDATANVLQRGWLRTGDIGKRIGGRVYVTGRLKDIIVTGGENVSAREVEEVLAAHPDVAECAVVGLPDEHYGQRVHAAIVLKPSSESNSEALDEFCRSRISRFKRPRSYEFVEALPRNALGKVLKHLIKGESAHQDQRMNE